MTKEKWVVFNKKGRKLRTVEIEAGYKGLEPFEKSLKEKDLYAHRHSSFEHRNEAWNRMTFKQKLELLGWEFNNGLIVNTDW